MIKRIDELPVLLTSFAYRPEYFPEVTGLLATVSKHHPDWPVVVGRGPVKGFERPTLELESPAGRLEWMLPVALDLDDTENDWRRITWMKGWWVEQVWRNFGGASGAGTHRLIWADADSRFNGPLDIDLDPEAEIVAGPWWYDPDDSNRDTLASCLLVFQGVEGGPVQKVIERWSNMCIGHIENVPPLPDVTWLDGDQVVLREAVDQLSASGAEFTFLKLEHDKYSGESHRDGTPLPGALIDQWNMSRKMKWPECRNRVWPPSEHMRRSR